MVDDINSIKQRTENKYRKEMTISENINEIFSEIKLKKIEKNILLKEIPLINSKLVKIMDNSKLELNININIMQNSISQKLTPILSLCIKNTHLNKFKKFICRIFNIKGYDLSQKYEMEISNESLEILSKIDFTKTKMDNDTSTKYMLDVLHETDFMKTLRNKMHEISFTETLRNKVFKNNKNMEMLKINGKGYVLDMNKIFEFIFESQNEKNAELEVSQRFETNISSGEQELISTEKRELKGKGNTAIDTIKYDMFKTFLDTLSQFPLSETKDNKLMPLTALQVIVFNSMLKEGYLIEINEE